MTGTHQVLHQDDAAAELPLDRSPSECLVRYTATLAVNEVMVRPQWRKQGIADELHSALLQERSENLAVLLVDVTHPKVQGLYETGGYENAGEQRPFADSPLYAVMVKSLPS